MDRGRSRTANDTKVATNGSDGAISAGVLFRSNFIFGAFGGQDGTIMKCTSQAHRPGNLREEPWQRYEEHYDRC